MDVTVELIQNWFTPCPKLCLGREDRQLLWGTALLGNCGQTGQIEVGLASRLPVGISGRTLLLVEDVHREMDGNDVLLFPAGTSLEQILSQAEQGFADCFRRMAQEQRILRASLSGSLKQLVKTGAEVLDRPVLLGDAILTVLAHGGQPDGPEEHWEEFIRAGYAPDFQTDAGRFAENSFPLNEQFVACRIPNEKMGWDDLLIDLDLGERSLGHLVISGRGGPIRPGEYGLIAALCLSIWGELRRRQEDQTFQRVTEEQFLAQLLRGELRGEMLDFRAALLDQPVEGNFSIVVVGLERYHPHQNSISTIRKDLEAVCGGASALMEDRLVQLLSRPNCRVAAARVLEENGLRGGLSRSFPHLEDAPRYYRQAERVLEILPQLSFEESLVEYGQAELPALLRQLSGEALEELARHPLVLRLAELDRIGKFSFTETLMAYLECAQRPAIACQRLHIHRNTLDYRLRRLEEELVELKWDRGEELIVLYLALRAKCGLEHGL